MFKVQLTKLALTIAPLLLTDTAVAAAPESTNALPFSAIGDVVAAEGVGAAGATRIYSQNANGDIVEACVTGPFDSGTTTGTDCRDNFENFVIVPANETMYRTPLAVAGLDETDNQVVYLFFLSPDRVISEYIISGKTNTFSGGSSCDQCITNEGLVAAEGSDALYAIGSTNATHAVRVGFISAGAPNTLTEAIWDMSNNHWSTAGLPSQ